jgi:beta-carotene 3-hydroxylase
MTLLGKIGVVLSTVLAMEVIAALVHRYLMHGFGWGWHESHHVAHGGRFEKNDLFAVLFGGVAIGLILVWSSPAQALYWVGIGMSVYGFLYFVVHDGLVHQRWPFRVVPKNAYLKRLVQAHRLHHAVEGREGCVSFGFLYARPVRNIREELKTLHPAKKSREAGTSV